MFFSYTYVKQSTDHERDESWMGGNEVDLRENVGETGTPKIKEIGSCHTE